jgi:general secretion pathway protein B
MSLILDALKKSEAERLRGQVPTLLSPLPAATSHTQAKRKSTFPLLILIALLVVALVLGYFFTKTQPEASPSIATAAFSKLPEQTSATIDPPPTSFTPKPALAEAVVVPPSTAAASMPTAPATPTIIVPESSEANPVIAGVESAIRVASLSELPAEQRQQLPALKLSMHVYSSDAGKRFAIIDGQRINEGSLLGAAVVEQIRQDGVVLSVQGQSYLLPRP